MPKAKRYIEVIIPLVLLFSFASLLLPTPAKSDYFFFHLNLASTLAATFLFIGGSLVLISGLKDFTPRLKQAYRLLCIGFTLVGLVILTAPLTLYAGSLESIFGSVVVGPFVISLVVILLGVRKLAHLFDVRNGTTSWWFILITPIVFIASYSLLPHQPTAVSELEFDMLNAFTFINGWILFLGMIYAFQIRNKTGPQYINAFAWLTIDFACGSVSALIYLSLTPLIGADYWFIKLSSYVLAVMASSSFLRAAYAFSQIPYAKNADLQVFTARNFFGKPLHNIARTHKVTSVDIVIYTANLASNPRMIDPILDRLRTITATLSEGQELSAEQEGTLMTVYLEIERFLIEDEPVRSFTKDSLRQTVANTLGISPEAGTFWQKLPS